MAKQFGVSDEAMEGLLDPAHHPFPPDQKVALELADEMTRGSGSIPDPLFERLSTHFTAAQIVEIASVIGLFNYFNRFNNMLRTDVTLMDPDVLMHRIEAILGREQPPADAAREALTVLAHGRRYASLVLYRLEGKRLLPFAVAGRPAEPGGTMAAGDRAADLAGSGTTRILVVPDVERGYIPISTAARSACIVPVLRDDRIAGALIAEQGLPDAFTAEDEEDRRLLEESARVLASQL